ncbi:hypothetical protein HZS_6131 [Henneguya salminicola]|nr:hypothetical protein HZS_6131 [Henneguya salminicola]
MKDIKRQLIEDNNLYTPNDLARILNITIDENTVWRWLKKLTPPINVKRNSAEIKLERKL